MTSGETSERRTAGSARPPRFLVLGVGNVLLSDEGVGVRVVEAMQEMTMPADVELLDGGTAAADLLDQLENRDRVIIIDAVQGGDEPGAVYRFTPADIRAKGDIHASVHQIGLLEALAMSQYLGEAPQNIVIYGIEPRELGWGLDLSREVAAVVPKVIESVLAELEG